MESVNPRQVHFEGSQPILRAEDMTANVEDPGGNVLRLGYEPE